VATPSLIVSRLQAMQRQNPLQQALQEVGRVAKTRHILSYVDDERLRRRVLIGLNKRGRVHDMARERSASDAWAGTAIAATRPSSTGHRRSAW
jgi:TnpA family transposase